MKKWSCMALAILLTLALALALAESAEIDEAAFGGAQRLETGEVYRIDLDGDGAKETVRLQMEGPTYEESLTLTVETDELVYSYPTYIYFNEEAFCADLDGDGAREILMSGDEASSDFSTWCLRFDRARGLQPVEFADANRGDNTDEYRDWGYGRVDAIDGDTLLMTGSQDALGTWWCSREFTLRDGRFELDDGGIWRVVEDFDNPDIWEFRSLILTREMPVTLEDGSSATLPAGTHFLITETDKVSYVGFLTEDGQRGTFPVEPDVESGWGFLIDGASEYDYFEYVPYAD